MMKTTHSHSVILFLAVVLAGCASTPGPEVNLRWPTPPEQAIVAYSRSIYGTASLKRSFFGRLKDFLFGKSPDHYFMKPYGVSSDGRSLVYLADTGKKSVVVLDLEAGTGEVIRTAGPNENLLEPVNVIPDRSGNIYVADTKLGKIAVYNHEWVFSHFIGAGGEISSPVGMAIDEERRRIFVVDSQLHEVHIFTLDGEHLRQFGRRGDERGEFYHPLGIAINSGDTLYVTDTFHFAVQAFDLEGNYLFSFGPRRRGVGTMASDGRVYVTDALKHEVQVYDPGGTYLFSFGGMGTETGQFRLPAGIFITKNGRIYVADSINRRIQEFVYLDHGLNGG
jgi:sugar lactone lactonase YvrE